MTRPAAGRLPRRVRFWPLAWALLACGAAGCGDSGAPPAGGRPVETDLYAGIARVPITPTGFEGFEDRNGNHLKDDDEPFLDTGLDGLYDAQEEGAYGPDGAPGIAGADDDGDGTVDNPSEYGSAGSDDVADPAGDNHDPTANPAGTEGDGVFQAVVLAGYQGLVTGDPIRPALTVHDDLYATALAIRCRGETVLLVSLDLVGLWHHYINPVKRRIEVETGVAFENVIVACTHTHAGPDSVGLWSYDFDPSYVRVVQDRILSAALGALDALAPARMKSCTVLPPACYDRETLVLKTEPDCRLADQEGPNMNPDSTFDRHIFQNDLRDPWVRNTRVTAMQFRHAATNRTLATLVNAHNHPEVFGEDVNVLSSDYPHYARRILEERFGGIAIYFNGTCGSQIGCWDPTPVRLWDEQGRPVNEPGVFDAEGRPFPRFVVEMGEQKARSMGIEVGNAAARGLAAAGFTQSPELEVRTGFVDVVPENLIAQAFSLLIVLLDPEALEEEDLPIQADYCPFPGCARVPVTVMHLGDASIVTAPGEVAPEYLLGRHASTAVYPAPHRALAFPPMPAIADHLPGRDTFFIGQANAYFGYFVPASDYLSPFSETAHPNYYEDELSAGPNFGDAVGNKIFELLGTDERFSDYPIRP